MLVEITILRTPRGGRRKTFFWSSVVRAEWSGYTTNFDLHDGQTVKQGRGSTRGLCEHQQAPQGGDRRGGGSRAQVDVITTYESQNNGESRSRLNSFMISIIPGMNTSTAPIGSACLRKTNKSVRSPPHKLKQRLRQRQGDFCNRNFETHSATLTSWIYSSNDSRRS